MNILFRVDASIQIGSGHLMRCLTLAEQLKKRGAEISFISRKHEGNLFNIINEKGFKLYQLKSAESNNIKSRTKHSHWLGVDWAIDAKDTIKILHDNGKVNWLIIDHYAIDAAWEKQVRPYVKNIMVIDDLADRPHDCHVLLDQNLYKDMDIRYKGLIPQNCTMLLGPKFALLRSEFTQARKEIRIREKVNRIFIFFGGTDLTNETLKTINALKQIENHDISIDIVVGKNNPHKEQIKNECTMMSNTKYYCQVNNISKLMAQADLAIGAGGTTTWERCCLGLPSLIISVALNQDEIAQEAGQQGIALYLGKSIEVSSRMIKENIKQLIGNTGVLKDISTKAANLVDGEGVFRVVDIILNAR